MIAVRILIASPLLIASDVLFNLGAIVAGSNLRKGA